MGRDHLPAYVSPLIRGKVVVDQWPLLGRVRSGAADSRWGYALEECWKEFSEVLSPIRMLELSRSCSTGEAL